MTVGAHYHQIGIQLFGVGNDRVGRSGGMANHHFDGNLLVFQLLGDAFQVFEAGFDLGGGGERAEYLAGDAFFDMEQVELGMLLPGHGGGMGDGLAVAAGMVERNEDLLVQRARQIRSHFLRQFDGGAAAAQPLGQDRMEGDPGEQQGQDGQDRNDQKFERDPRGAGARQPVANGDRYQPQIEHQD